MLYYVSMYYPGYVCTFVAMFVHLFLFLSCLCPLLPYPAAFQQDGSSS